MSYWNGAWNALKFSSKSAGESVLSSFSYRYLRKQDGTFIYKNNRAYKDVLVHVSKQFLAQQIEGQVNSLFPRYQRYLENTWRKKTLSQQDQNRKQLIKNGEESLSKNKYGRMQDPNGMVLLQNRYGKHIPEGLLLRCESDREIEMTTIDNSPLLEKEPKKPISATFKTKSLYFADLAPSVSIQSNKNLIQTQVQGRDFTRKELVSGGDLSFSVSGNITVDQEGVYPTNDVKKFVKIMQYGGVIDVNHYLFGQFNIDKIIIQSFSLETPECKNMQPYSFTCVAVEPDEDVVVASDTIGVLNQEISKSPMDSWYNFILNNKLAEITANVAANTISSSANAGLGALLPNI